MVRATCKATITKSVTWLLYSLGLYDFNQSNSLSYDLIVNDLLLTISSGVDSSRDSGLLWQVDAVFVGKIHLRKLQVIFGNLYDVCNYVCMLRMRV